MSYDRSNYNTIVTLISLTELMMAESKDENIQSIIQLYSQLYSDSDLSPTARELGLALGAISTSINMGEAREDIKTLISAFSKEPWDGKDYATFVQGYLVENPTPWQWVELLSLLDLSPIMGNPAESDGFLYNQLFDPPAPVVTYLFKTYSQLLDYNNDFHRFLLFKFIVNELEDFKTHTPDLLKAINQLPVKLLKKFYNYYFFETPNKNLKTADYSPLSKIITQLKPQIHSVRNHADNKKLLFAACCIYSNLRKQEMAEYRTQFFCIKGKSRTEKLNALPHLVDLILYNTPLPADMVPIVNNGKMKEIYKLYNECPDKSPLCNETSEMPSNLMNDKMRP